MLDESPTKGFVREDAVLGPYKYDGTLARTGFLASIPMCSNSNTLHIDQTTDFFPRYTWEPRFRLVLVDENEVLYLLQ